MSVAKLKKSIKKFGDVHLVPKGYSQRTPYIFEKSLEGFSQGLGFVNGTGGYKGFFTVDVYWRYTHSPINSEGAMDYYQRIGELCSGRDLWYKISEEESFKKILKIFEGKIEALFDKYKNIKTIISDYESKKIDSRIFFGIDEGWRAYNIGYCYLMLNEIEKAKKYLEQVVNEFSIDNYHWVIERKDAVISTLHSLGKDKGVRS